MEKKQRIMIAAIIGVMIIVVIILKILGDLSSPTRNVNSNTNNEQNTAEVTTNKTVDAEGKPIRVNDDRLFFTINDCLKSYMLISNTEETEVLIKYLNENYIKEKQINKENVLKVVERIETESYRTYEMYQYDENTFGTYYIKGKSKGKNVYFEVGLDKNNTTFDVLPLDEKSFNSKINHAFEENESIARSINNKTYNYVKYTYLSDEIITRFYFTDYIRLMLNYPEDAYNILDEQYKNLKFGSIDNFKSYINSNKQYLESIYQYETVDASELGDFKKYYEIRNQNKFIGMKNYQVTSYDNYKQYMCADGYQYFYIFNVEHPGSYKALLDTYTIDIPQFVKQYSRETDKNRVLLNVEKIKNAINSKDFRYVFNKLNETFKKNNYKDSNSLKNFLVSNLFQHNKFEYSNAKKENGVYIIVSKVSDLEEKQKGTKELTIIMNLKENKDFEISFSIK